MKLLAAALTFLTRIPVPTGDVTDPRAVGRAAALFPFVGVFFGLVFYGFCKTFIESLPPLVLALCVVALESLVSGCLHLDGLADTADGFGGGRSREDTLRIMRDHAIGSYGAAALVFCVLAKVSSLGELIERRHAGVYLFLYPVLGRWSPVVLSFCLPYARRSAEEGKPPDGAVAEYVRWREMIAATLVSAVVVAAGLWQAVICSAAVVVCCGVFGLLCRSRIGGVTGDTLGAAVEISEVAVLMTGVVLAQSRQ